MSHASIRERPILFSGPMVRAILSGRKTATRRVVKGVFRAPAPIDGDCVKDWDGAPSLLSIAPRNWEMCPYGVPGERLWVRERLERRDGVAWHYSADGHAVLVDRADATAMVVWAHHKMRESCPSIHMPRWASRLTLEITGTRVERLQEITEADAKAEGIRSDILPACGDHPDLECYVSEPDDNHAYRTRVEAFRASWDHLNGPRGFAWRSNPWVWVVGFRKVEPEGGNP